MSCVSCQVLYLHHNDLVELPADVFQGLADLRVISMAHNQLRHVPDGALFAPSWLERLDLAYNQLSRIPVSAFSASSGRSLCELDLSHNFIAAIHPVDAISRLKVGTPN